MAIQTCGAREWDRGYWGKGGMGDIASRAEFVWYKGKFWNYEVGTVIQFCEVLNAIM